MASGRISADSSSCLRRAWIRCRLEGSRICAHHNGQVYGCAFLRKGDAFYFLAELEAVPLYPCQFYPSEPWIGMGDYLAASRECPKLQVWTDCFYSCDGIDEEINIFLDSLLGPFASPSSVYISYPGQLYTFFKRSILLPAK
jgi:hypothetical protein